MDEDVERLPSVSVRASGVRGGVSTDDESVSRSLASSAGTYYVRVVGAGEATYELRAVARAASASDFDGDGVSDLVVYRPSTGKWYVRGSVGVSWSQGWGGVSGDVPVSGDFDGDGVSDLVVYRPSTGKWYVQGSVGVSWSQGWGGGPGDLPVGP